MNTISNQALAQHKIPDIMTRSIRDVNDGALKSSDDDKGGGIQVALGSNGVDGKMNADKIADRYTDTVDAIIQGQSDASAKADKTTSSEKATELSELAPLVFFNAGDVAAYEEHLMSELSSRGVDTSIPISLRVDYVGNIVVKGDHPDKETIEKTLNGDIDLRNGFVQTSNFYMFKEIFSQHEQWADKIDSGVSEEIANLWLIDAVKNTVAKSSRGLTFEDGRFADPFASEKTSLTALKQYQS